MAAQIPCDYCLFVHEKAAKMNGATQAEIDEAFAIASDTRHWSTSMHGLQVDEASFERDVDELLERMKSQMAAQASK